MIHVYSHYEPSDAETRRRITLAAYSWKRQGWKEAPLHDSVSPRLFQDGNRRVPYVKDLLSYGCNLAEDEEIVVFTNSDIICRSDCSAMIAAQLQDSHAIYSHRRDFGRLDLIPDDSNFSLGSEYAGTDLFAFRAYWWKAYCDSFPDLLLSFEGWDACLCHLIVWTNPGGKTVLKDITCHERHASRWENPANRKTLPGQVHNIQNASAWLLKHGINPAIHGITYA